MPDPGMSDGPLGCHVCPRPATEPTDACPPRCLHRRTPRPCPICSEIYEPRKVGGKWTKTCSRACGDKLRGNAL
jgi:hypothetical protein